MPGKILVVEDDQAIARAVTRLLSREGYFVAVCGDTDSAVAHLKNDPNYDLALLDVGLPGKDGFACCRELRNLGWRAPLLMLTGRTSSLDRVRGLDAGADDYISKPADPTELLARVRSHLRRVRDYNAPEDQASEIQLGAGLIVDLNARDAVQDGLPRHLTEREFELLVLLAKRAGESVDKNWLFQQVWGCSPEEGNKVLAVYVRRLRQKIEVDPDHPRHLLTVRGFGYRVVAE